MSANEDNEDMDEQGEKADLVSQDTAVVPKKKKKRAAADSAALAADGLPKDRNKRVREQAARKVEEAKASAKSRAHRIGATGLDTTEMLDDVFARSVAATTKWIKKNRRAVEASIAGLILLGVGYATFDWYTTKTREKGSTALMSGVANAGGVVQEGEDASASAAADGAKVKKGARPRFASQDARQVEALRAYREAASDFSS